MTNKEKFSFENKNGKNGIVIIEGEETGKSNRPLLEDFAKRNGYPVFKGHVEHAYESDFTKQKKSCPKCGAPTLQMMSNFGYATQTDTRLSTSHAGHFCTACPTVIIDDDLMRTIVPQGVRYGGVTSHESSYNDTFPVFKTFNGKQPIFIMNPQKTNVEGIMGSLNLIDDDHTYLSKNGEILGDRQQTLRKINPRLKKRRMSLKKAKRGRKK